MLPEQPESGAIRRRDVLRGMVAAGAMAVSPPFAGRAAAKHPSGSLPRTIEEAGKLIQTRKVSVTELTTASSSAPGNPSRH